MDHEVKRSRPSGQHGETPSLLKIQKLTGHGGACLQSQLLRRLRQENCLNPGGGGCSELRSCHCTPVWVTTAKLRLKKKKKILGVMKCHYAAQAGCESWTQVTLLPRPP